MNCDNCGKYNANIKYIQNINGKEQKINLCENCSHILGIQFNTNSIFDIPLDFSNYFIDFMDEYEFETLGSNINEEKVCKICGYTYEDILKGGKLGCGNCYNTFEKKLNPIIKKIQGSDIHIGRKGNLNSKTRLDKDILKQENEKENNLEKDKYNIMQKLKEDLRKAIIQEEYEEAAKIRDEIKKIDN